MSQVIPGVGTSEKPAAVIAPDGQSVFLAWRGEGDDQRIYWTQTQQLAPDPSTGQYTFSPSPQAEAGFGTSHGPALASFQGCVYMAWKGEEGDHAIYWSRWDGISWQAQTKLQAETRTAPAMVATGDAIFLVFQGNSDNNIWWAMLGDSFGANFIEIGPIKVDSTFFQTAATPALTTDGNTVYLAWLGAGTDQLLYWAQCNEDLQALYPQGNIPDLGGLAAYGNYQWGNQQQIPPYANSGGWDGGAFGAGPTQHGPALAFVRDNPGNSFPGLWIGWVAAMGSDSGLTINLTNNDDPPPPWSTFMPTSDSTTNQIALIGVLSAGLAPIYFFRSTYGDQIFYNGAVAEPIESSGQSGGGGATNSSPGPENPAPPYTHGGQK